MSSSLLPRFNSDLFTITINGIGKPQLFSKKIQLFSFLRALLFPMSISTPDFHAQKVEKLEQAANGTNDDAYKTVSIIPPYLPSIAFYLNQCRNLTAFFTKAIIIFSSIIQSISTIAQLCRSVENIDYNRSATPYDNHVIGSTYQADYTNTLETNIWRITPRQRSWA